MRNLLIQAVAFLCMHIGALATPLAAASAITSPNDRNPWTPIGSDWEMRLRPSWQVMSERQGQRVKLVDGFELVELSTYGRPLKPRGIKERREGSVAYVSVYSYTAQQQNFTDLHAQLPRLASADTVKTAIATEQRGDLTQRTFAVHDFRANTYEYSSRYVELRSPTQAIVVVLHWSAADHVIAEEITEMCLSIRQADR